MTATTKTLLALVLIAIGVVVAGVLVVGAAGDGLDDRAEAILEDPAEFVDERVEVSGELSGYYAGAFTLGGGWLNGDELVVLVDELDALPAPLRDRADDIDVRVVGVVGRKDESLELVPGEQFEPFENGTPYVRAERVEVVDD